MRLLLLLLLFPMFAHATAFTCGDFALSTERRNTELVVTLQEHDYVFPRRGHIYELGDARIHYSPVFGVETMTIEVGPRLPLGATLLEMLQNASRAKVYRCVSENAVSTTPWKELK